MRLVRRGLVATGVLVAAGAAACSVLTPLDDLTQGYDAGADSPAAPRCEGGLAACNGACVDLSSDGRNCGRCGHDCVGGGCSASACLPLTIATGQHSPFGIAVDATRVYWANNDYKASFASCPITGCADGGVTTLLDNQDLPADVFVSGGKLYMTDYGVSGDAGGPGLVLSCDPTNCAATLATITSTTPDNPVAVVADKSSVFWTNAKDGTIGTCSAIGCVSPGTFAKDKGGGPWYGLAIAGNGVYWTSDVPDAGAVNRCDVGGCAAPTLVSSSPGRPFDLAVFGDSVYWTTGAGGQVLRCPLAGCSTPQIFADNQAAPAGIAADASGVYWLNQASGTVLRCDLQGCGANGPAVLAGGQGAPWEIVLDATSLYWGDSASADGRVMRLAKP